MTRGHFHLTRPAFASMLQSNVVPYSPSDYPGPMSYYVRKHEATIFLCGRLCR